MRVEEVWVQCVDVKLYGEIHVPDSFPAPGLVICHFMDARGFHGVKVCARAIKAKLEPYLGFLHSMAEGKASLICDFMELYRYLIDDFVIQYCRRLQKRDFIMKNENFSTSRKGKREYLNDSLTHGLIKGLNEYFQTKVEIPRIRMGKEQEIETLINEEALLFAMFLRNERQLWKPRIPELH